MQASIEINMDNAAFGEDGIEKANELRRILIKLADKLDVIDTEDGEDLPIKDVNGNTVGRLCITGDYN